MAKNVETVPDGYTSVTPWLPSKDSAAVIDFMKQAFDAEETGRVHNPNGSIGHAEVRIGDSIVLLFDWPKATPTYLRVYVENADATHQKSLEAGATTITRPIEAPWGDKVARIRDPFGNVWWIHERLGAFTAEEMAQRFADANLAANMEYLQSSFQEYSRTLPD